MQGIKLYDLLYCFMLHYYTETDILKFNKNNKTDFLKFTKNIVQMQRLIVVNVVILIY